MDLWRGFVIFRVVGLVVGRDDFFDTAVGRRLVGVAVEFGLGIGELAVVLETVTEVHELLVGVHEDALELDFVAREAVDVGGAVLHDIAYDLFLAGFGSVGIDSVVNLAFVLHGRRNIGGLEAADAL